MERDQFFLSSFNSFFLFLTLETFFPFFLITEDGSKSFFLHFLELVNLNFFGNFISRFQEEWKKKEREKKKKQRTISNFFFFHGGSMIELGRDGEEEDRVNKDSRVFFLSIWNCCTLSLTFISFISRIFSILQFLGLDYFLFQDVYLNFFL